jgi:AAHS family 4-hydroxybenzoate transporter-like MFS transporter
VTAPNNPIDITELIDQRPLGRFQFWTVALCFLVAVLDGFDMQAIGYVAPAVAATLKAEVASFGPVFAIGLLGITLGSAGLGPIADRIGRKWPIVTATLFFGLATALTSVSMTFNELLAARFLTGLGLGAAMPNIIALTSEYAPIRVRNFLVTALFGGVSTGALLGGLLSSALLPDWGWRSVFYVGAAVPILATPLLAATLPESLRFLVAQNADSRRIASALRRVASDRTFTPDQRFILTESGGGHASVVRLFENGRAATTIPLWIAFFMSLLIVLFLSSWLPTMLRQAGHPLQQAIFAVAILNLGGAVGSVLIGHFIDRMGPFVVLCTVFGGGAILVGAFGYLDVPFPILAAVTFMIGFCVHGAQSGCNGLAASLYPTTIRATGVGWALGVGRIGSIVAPLIGGAMLSSGWKLPDIFLAAALPSLCAATAIAVIGRPKRRTLSRTA